MTNTRHTHPVVFGRLEAGCARCVELSNGAPVRPGWGSPYRETAAALRRDLDAHFRSQRHSTQCQPVCTYGDW